MDNHQRNWPEYYKKVISRQPSPILVEACRLIPEKARTIAVDCGCGAGRDTAYLLEQGFEVHGFDVEKNALEICRERFIDDPDVYLSLSSFELFDYPKVSLVNAGCSLFFCSPESFTLAWKKMTDSLEDGGLFCGDFLGYKDSWLEDESQTLSFFNNHEMKRIFDGFEILKWLERDEQGKTALGRNKYWHTYSVIARKQKG